MLGWGIASPTQRPGGSCSDNEPRSPGGVGSVIFDATDANAGLRISAKRETIHRDMSSAVLHVVIQRRLK